MKLKGIKISGPNVETIVIPRGDDQIVLHAQAILDMEEFEKLCPDPVPPMRMVKGGVAQPDTTDPHFIAACAQLGKRRMAFMIVRGLLATEGLEWETVDLNNPDTWLNYETELQASGFSNVEVNRIVAGVMAANCLSESKIEEARQRFSQSRQQAAELLSSQTAALKTTLSGAPANTSA